MAIIVVARSETEESQRGRDPCTHGEVVSGVMPLRARVIIGLSFVLALAACDDAKTGDAPASTPEAAPSEPTPEGKTEGKTEGKQAAAKDGEQAGGLAVAVQGTVESVREQGATGGSAEPVEVPVDPAAPPTSAAGWSSGTTMAEVGSVAVRSDDFFAIFDLKVDKYVKRGREIPKTAARRYRKALLDRLTYQELLRQEADRVGATYAPAELLARSEQQKRGIRDWAKHLERRGETNASLEAMYIAELREKAIIDAAGGLAVSRAEIEADYEKISGNWKSSEERVRAAHILVPIGAPSGPPEPEAKKKAIELHAEATKPGADFAAIARAHSTGPSSKKGGDLGIFTKDRMAEEFSDAAFAMKVGEVSKPVKTKFGYHVIKLLGRWPKGELPIDALEDQIKDRLRQRKLHQGRRELKERLLAGTKVTWWLDLETGARLSAGAPPETVKPSKPGHEHEHEPAPGHTKHAPGDTKHAPGDTKHAP